MKTLQAQVGYIIGHHERKLTLAGIAAASYAATNQLPAEYRQELQDPNLWHVAGISFGTVFVIKASDEISKFLIRPYREFTRSFEDKLLDPDTRKGQRWLRIKKEGTNGSFLDAYLVGRMCASYTKGVSIMGKSLTL